MVTGSVDEIVLRKLTRTQKKTYVMVLFVRQRGIEFRGSVEYNHWKQLADTCGKVLAATDVSLFGDVSQDAFDLPGRKPVEISKVDVLAPEPT
jgi:hypothetical protein